ncbi:MAG: hypothetical protein P4L46_19780 [Fimbriimonas sp.]|nr:hypothetical protein [Fimbriimonas sp.]
MSVGVARTPSLTLRIPRFNAEVTAVSLLIFVYTLLPLDRGVPGIPFAGKPLAPSVCATMALWFYLSYTSKNSIWKYLKLRYVRLQGACTLLLFVASFDTEFPMRAMQWAILYFCVFGLNYVILVYMIERYGLNWLIRTTLFCCSLAAFIGVLDTIGGFRIPLYQKFIDESMKSNGEAITGFDIVRGIGTQGNPILMATLMMVCIPYVFNVKSPILRVVFLAILAAGAAITVSRTIALGIIVFVIGLAVIYTRKFWICLGALCVLATGVFLSGAADKLLDDPIVMVWASRIGIGSSAGSEGSENVATRQEASKLAISKILDTWGPKEVVLGAGPGSSTEVGQEFRTGQDTIDNSTLTVLYERGFLGFILFYTAFFYILWQTRKQAKTSLHWYNLVALLAAGMSFDFEGNSTFNLLVMGSLAIVSTVPFAAVNRTTDAPELPTETPMGEDPG